MQAVILVGGFGTRLRPLTSTRPKPLIPFANEPFLLHPLRQLAAAGIRDVILSTMYLPETFDGLVPLAHAEGIEVTLSSEPAPLGTSGAVKLVEERLDETFFVLNGDIIADVDLTDLLATHRSSGAAATLSLVRVPDPSAYGLVPVGPDGRVRAFLEKPGPDEWVTDLVNAGLYVLQRDVLRFAPAGAASSFERTLFPSLLAAGGDVRGYEITGYWRDLGTPQAYLQAQFDLLEGRLQLPLDAQERAPGQWFGDGTKVDEGAVLRGPVLVGAGAQIEAEARVFGPVVLGPDVSIAASARVERSVLFAATRIDAGARVSDALIGEGVVVGAGAIVRDGAVLGDDVVVDGGNVLGGNIRVAPGVHLGPGAISL